MKNEDDDYKALKKESDKLIKSDRFIDLTLTYDFEEEQPKIKSNKKSKGVTNKGIIHK